MLENKEKALIEAYLTYGQVKIFVSFEEDKNKAFIIGARGPLVIEGNNIQTDVNYYIIIESLSDHSELTLSVR